MAHLFCLSFVKFILIVFIISKVDVAMSSYNTYSTPFVRNTPYNPRITNKVCFLKPDRGPCRANVDMIYFSPEFRNCSTFKWGGCQGNGNRFNTIEECTSYCLSPPNEDRSRPKYCTHTFDYGFCFGAVNRYYFDSKWQICKKTIYSGCGGNRNNFESEAQCESVCRVGRFRTRPTTTSDRLKKMLIMNPQHASTRKSRNQVTGGAARAGGGNPSRDNTQDKNNEPTKDFNKY